MGYIIIAVSLESLAIAKILNGLFGGQWHADWRDVVYVFSEAVFYGICNAFELPYSCMIVGYLLVIGYSLLKFHADISSLIVNDTLTLLISTLLQFLTGTALMLFSEKILHMEMRYFLCNLLFLLLAVVIARYFRLSRLSAYFLKTNALIVVTVVADFVVAAVYVVNVRKNEGIYVLMGIAVYALIFLFVLLAFSLGKSIIRSKNLEAENEMQRLYNQSFAGLVGEIRLHQHEFDNHISAICGMRYTCHSLEELTLAQGEYVREIVRENKYNKLLSSGNFTLTGFLYQKFTEMDSDGIEVVYHVAVREMESGVPVYVLIEMIGNLLDNAREALAQAGCEKKVYVNIREDDAYIEIEIANRSAYISFEEIDHFFERGSSSKGTGRGYGLYHVKQRCAAYHIDLACTNKEIHMGNDVFGNGDLKGASSENYISFILRVKKK